MRPSFGPEALVSAAFSRCSRQGRAAFLPFLVAGDPNPLVSKELLAAVARGGADLLELGIPFSDPLADGPAIASASARALAGGMSLAGALRLVRDLGKRLGEIPVLGFTYYNVLLTHGLESTAQSFAACGLCGVIVPDVPLEESGPLRSAFARYGLVVPMLVSPTTPPDRAVRIAQAASGFVYVVSRAGVTGTHAGIGEIRAQIELLRRATATPIVVGFGVSHVRAVRQLAAQADGVIVGSALVECAAAARDSVEAIEAVASRCRELARGCLRQPAVAGNLAASE